MPLGAFSIPGDDAESIPADAVKNPDGRPTIGPRYRKVHSVFHGLPFNFHLQNQPPEGVIPGMGGLGRCTSNPFY